MGRKPTVAGAKAVKEVVPDELRCRRSDGKSWRCRRAALPGLALCPDHHGRQSKKKHSSDNGDRASNLAKRGRKRTKAVPAEASNLPKKRGRKPKQKIKEEKSEAEESDSGSPERNNVQRTRFIKEKQEQEEVEDSEYRVRAMPAEASTSVKRGRKRKQRANEEKSEVEERFSIASGRNIAKRMRLIKEKQEEQEDAGNGPIIKPGTADSSIAAKRGRKRKRKAKEQNSESEERDYEDEGPKNEIQEKLEDEEDSDYGPRGRGGVRIKREDSGGHIMKKILHDGLTEIAVVSDAGPDFKKVFEEATDAVTSTPKQVDFSLPNFHTEQDKRKHGRKTTQGIKDKASPLLQSHSHRTLNGEEAVHSGVVPDEFRCKRSDGKQWRCSARVMEGRTYCEKHYFQFKKRHGGITMTHKMKRGRKGSHNRKEDLKISSKTPQKEVKKKHINSKKHKVKDDEADVISSDSEDSQIREKEDHNNKFSLRNEKPKEKVVHKVLKRFDRQKVAVDGNLPKHRRNRAQKTDVKKSQNRVIMVGI